MHNSRAQRLQKKGQAKAAKTDQAKAQTERYGLWEIGFWERKEKNDVSKQELLPQKKNRRKYKKQAFVCCLPRGSLDGI